MRTSLPSRFFKTKQPLAYSNGNIRAAPQSALPDTIQLELADLAAGRACAHHVFECDPQLRVGLPENDLRASFGSAAPFVTRVPCYA